MKTILVDAVGTFVIKGLGIYKPLYELLEQYLNKKLGVSNNLYLMLMCFVQVKNTKPIHNN